MTRVAAVSDRGAAADAAAGPDGIRQPEPPGHEAARVTDGDPDTYWRPSAETARAVLELDLGSERSFDRVVLKEHIREGQRIERFPLEAEEAGGWRTLCEGTVVGYKRICRFKWTRARRLRLRIEESRWFPTLTAIEVYSDARVRQ